MAKVFTDRRCLEHRVPGGFPERPERLEAILGSLAAGPRAVSETAELGGPVDHHRPAVLAVHDEDYVHRFEKAVERGDGLLDSADNPLSRGTWIAAWAAVGATLAAADWAAEAPQEDATALAVVRPPGHHAERGLAMGFCFFNNVAVAAQHLLDRHGVERVAIYDFDVHHGNGTQHIFEEHPDVLYVSTHQFPFYPGSGAATETGHGRGAGTTLNLPLAAGSDDEVYGRALEEHVVPAIRAFEPQLLLLSAGFDAWRNDPLGGMSVSEDGFYRWGRRLGELAAELCQGRVVAVLEGGYDLKALPGLVEAHLAGLGGPSRP